MSILINSSCIISSLNNIKMFQICFLESNPKLLYVNASPITIDPCFEYSNAPFKQHLCFSQNESIDPLIINCYAYVDDMGSDEKKWIIFFDLFVSIHFNLFHILYFILKN